jgi:hypothetical protein
VAQDQDLDLLAGVASGMVLTDALHDDDCGVHRVDVFAV